MMARSDSSIKSVLLFFACSTVVLLFGFVALDDRTWAGTGLGKIILNWLPSAVAVSLLAAVAHYFIEKRYGLKDEP